MHDEKSEALRATCYQTVDIFSGVTSRKLFLTASKDRKAWTNGHLINLPFKDPNAYTMLEHEIGHILFRSDFFAKTVFIRDYIEKVTASASLNGVLLNITGLGKFLGDVVNVLEDRRVNSLWGLLYPGSAVKLDRTMWDHTSPYLERTKTELITFIVCCASGHTFPTTHPFSSFERPVRDALSQVERRGFASTLALSKWLVARLLDGILKEYQRLPPPPTPPQKALTGDENEGDGQEDGGDGHSVLAPPEGVEEEAIEEDPDPPVVEEPPQVVDSPALTPAALRAQAMQALLQQAGSLPPIIGDYIDDVKEDEFASRDEQRQSGKTARTATQFDPNDGAGLAKILDQDQRDMFDIVRRARETIRQPQSKDNYLTHGAKAKVVLANVARREREPPATVEAAEKRDQQDFDDFETVRRMRQVFNRIQGRRRQTLDIVGSEVDVQAVLERQMTGMDVPIFKHDMTGKGFRAVLLVDQSHSMKGERIQEAGRACRIITKALRLPNVDFLVWGFASTADRDEAGNPIKSGVVHIDRFDPQTEDYGEAKYMLTPLHTALHLARREMESSKDICHIFVLTDGDPTFLTARHAQLSGETMRESVRQEVVACRRRGIPVTAVVIGEEIEEKWLYFMFGSDWRRLTQDNFGRALVDLVTASFIRFVKAN